MVLKRCRWQTDFILVTVNIKHQQFSTVEETPDMISYSQLISWLHVLNKEGVLYQYTYQKKLMCQLLFYQGFSWRSNLKNASIF